MNTSVPLGRLEKIRVRDAWPDEARNFTPWLASEGLSLLQEELGVPLKLIRVEHSVGRYSLDILATELSENGDDEQNLVVIENQFGATDHDHLGKLMTYASGVGTELQGARTVIWIAEDLREEHQQALEWLNEISKSAVRFYGVQLELYRIGESEPAPVLNVLVRPNEVVRARQAAPPGHAESDRNLFYIEYWTQFKAFCIDNNAIFSLQSPRPQHWIEAALGKTGIFLTFVGARRDKWIGCELHIRTSEPKAALIALQKEADEIELILSGISLRWNLLAKSAKVQAVQEGIALDEKANWENQHRWLFETGEKMYRAFAPRIKRL